MTSDSGGEAQLASLGDASANSLELRNLAKIPVFAMMLLFIIRFAGLSVSAFRGYNVPAFDFGIFDQGTWLLSRFKDPFVTIMGRNLFGDHSSYILILVAPLYWIYPHAVTLLILQTVAIAAGALPIYLLGRQCQLSHLVIYALVAAYLVNPAIQQITMEGFHPECFLPLFIGTAIYAAVAWKPRILIIAVILTALVKEDVALLLLPLGLWTAIRRDRRYGVAICVGSVLWSALESFAIMPAILGYFSPSDEGRMPFGGWSGFVNTVAPVKFSQYLAAGGRSAYLWQMLFPTGFLFILSPEIAATSFLVLATNTLSPIGYLHQIVYHYSLAPTLILMLGTAFSIGALRTRRRQILAATAVLICSVWASLLWGFMPYSIDHPIITSSHDRQTVADNYLVNLVPSDAVVSADTYFVVHLDHRDSIYLWPNPFSAWAYGDSESNQRLPVASSVKYLLLAWPQKGSDLATLLHIAPDFHLVALRGAAALFERGR